jgi:hypothetical protein
MTVLANPAPPYVKKCLGRPPFCLNPASATDRDIHKVTKRDELSTLVVQVGDAQNQYTSQVFDKIYVRDSISWTPS